MIDQHFTSPELAELMVEAVPKGYYPPVVGDFAAGDGSLLGAAQQRWPESLLLGNDMSRMHTRTLKDRFPAGIVSCSDFMQEHSSRRAIYQGLRGAVDLLLLNPPFSQRGIPPIACTVGAHRVRAGLALAFVCRAAEFLAADGLLVAIVPDGCLVSERDRAAWVALRSRFRVEFLCENDIYAFSGVRAKTWLVKLTPARTFEPPLLPCTPNLAKVPNLVRGHCQMHDSNIQIGTGKGTQLVHTSDLAHGKVIRSNRTVAGREIMVGPAVLVPRVGNPTPQKIAVLPEGCSVTLSDCVIAVPCKTSGEADQLRKRIVDHWPIFSASYRGTGAPYTTVARAAEVIQEIFEANARGSSDTRNRQLNGVHHGPTLLEFA